MILFCFAYNNKKGSSINNFGETDTLEKKIFLVSTNTYTFEATDSPPEKNNTNIFGATESFLEREKKNLGV